MPTFTSSTGGADIETRIVSPIPSASKIPNAVALTRPIYFSIDPISSGIDHGRKMKDMIVDIISKNKKYNCSFTSVDT